MLPESQSTFGLSISTIHSCFLVVTDRSQVKLKRRIGMLESLQLNDGHLQCKDMDAVLLESSIINIANGDLVWRFHISLFNHCLSIFSLLFISLVYKIELRVPIYMLVSKTGWDLIILMKEPLDDYYLSDKS